MRNIGSITVILLVGIFLIFFSMCNSNIDNLNNEDSFDTPIDKYLDSTINTDEKENVTEGAIYLDTSISMQGYIRDPNYKIPFSLLQHLLHNVLQTSFHHVGISRPTFKCFGSKIITPETPMKHYAINDGKISPRSRYNCTETNIVSIFHEASKNTSSLSVIITDGSQDVYNVNGSLAPGFDRPEFIQSVSNGLIDKEFGVWLIGIMNDFDGYYYNIIPDKNGEINSPHYVKGKRPVYCWVISKNIKKGREFVQYLYDDITRLARTNLEDKKGNMVQVIEIAPGIYPHITLTESKPHKYFKFDNETSERLTFILDWRNSTHHLANKIAKIDFPKVPGKSVLFVLQVRLDFNMQYNWNSFPQKMWQVTVKQSGTFPKTLSTRIPDINKPDSKNLRFVFIDFPHDRLVVLNENERKFKIPVCLYADLYKGLDNCWVKAWSTVIDTEERFIQGKTLYLYEIVSELLKKTIGEKRVGTCLSLALIKRNG